MTLAGVLTSCETSDAERGEVVSLINITRQQNGLPPLNENLELNVKADAWAAAARECRIYHSRLADGAPPSWQKLGENIGRGGTISRSTARLSPPAATAATSWTRRTTR